MSILIHKPPGPYQKQY